MYPPSPDKPETGFVNLANRFTKEQAWRKTSKEHRRLARFRAQRAIEQIEEG